jgi:hypothetical protein
MNQTVRRGTVALALIGGVALLAAPAAANSIHNNGHFGGTWSRIGPSQHYLHRRFYGPGYAYGYGRPYAYYGGPYGYGLYDDDAPALRFYGPGFGVGF